ELLRHQFRELRDRVRLHDTDPLAVRRGHAPPVDAFVLALPQDERAAESGGDPEQGFASSTYMRAGRSAFPSRLRWRTPYRSRRRTYPALRSRVGNLVPAAGAVSAPCARPGWESVCAEGPTSRTWPAREMDNGGSGVAVVRWHIGDDTSFEGIEHLLSHRA